MSFLPISIRLPFSAIQRQDSWSMSPVSEFKQTSTPLPFVIFIISSEKEVVREENIRLLGIPISCPY
jgi:hypothetical protein